ncbi:MAG: N-acetylneuraminate synthase [Rhodospirillales bacterium]|nr:N-acetylneuraminate synthase [Rhodospirillales bacterium]
MVEPFHIGQRQIGAGAPCFIIAEAGVNHDGDLSKAFALIDKAAKAGADAVKFQTYITEKLVDPSAPKAEYQKLNDGAGESQFEMLKRLELSKEDHFSLLNYCQEKDILFLSSPFEEESADFLVDLGIPAFKVPSGEITNLAFLKHLVSKKLPMIVSTGMATVEEVSQAVGLIREVPFSLLHCVSAYPADPKDCNLKAIETLERRFNCPAGWSDHTPGIEVALAAVALGACVIEKHFTLDKYAPGPDHKASMEPNELSALVMGVRKIESALGSGEKAPVAEELRIAAVARKSLAAAQNLTKGVIITQEDLKSRRPGTGISPSRIDEVIGRKVTRDIPVNTLLTLEMIED